MAQSTSVTYIGPSDAVEITAADGVVIGCKNGEPVAVSADLAKSLLEQADAWAAVKARPAASTPAPAASREETAK